MLDWNAYEGEVLSRVKELAGLSPDTVRGYATLSAAGSKTSHLDAKTRELISLAVAVTTRCDGCIVIHTHAAMDHGIGVGVPGVDAEGLRQSCAVAGLDRGEAKALVLVARGDEADPARAEYAHTVIENHVIVGPRVHRQLPVVQRQQRDQHQNDRRPGLDQRAERLDPQIRRKDSRPQHITQ